MTISSPIEQTAVDPDYAQSRAHCAATFKVTEDELLRAIGIFGMAPAALEFYLRRNKPRIQRGIKQMGIAKELRRARPMR